MWKDFSRSYLARNRAAGWTVAAAALAAAFFLSLLCSLAYNLWVYEIRRITQEEGGWHARVTVAQDGGQPDETLQKLTQFANVETAVLSPAPAAEASSSRFRERLVYFSPVSRARYSPARRLSSGEKRSWSWALASFRAVRAVEMAWYS